MAIITYIEYNGSTHTLDIENGTSVMRGALDNLVEGIVAECGGNCNCATCHCYVDESWVDKLPPAHNTEKDLLDCVSERKPNSRLSCQITVSDELDGLTVRLPKSQY